MIVYISGGCKNGKSAIAEKIANNMKKNDKFYYIATMNPVDSEDEMKIEKHRESRKHLGFKTIEITKDIKKLENMTSLEGTFLIDSVTAILANEMFSKDAIFENAYEKVAEDLLYTIEKMENVVLVSDYIFSDSIKYDKYTNLYKKGLAYIDRACAKKADIVIEVCYNNVIIHKGKEKYDSIKIC